MHHMCNTSQHSRRFPSLESPSKSNPYSIHPVSQQGVLPALEFRRMDSCYWSNVTRQAMLLFMAQSYSTRGLLLNLLLALLGSSLTMLIYVFWWTKALSPLENITRNRIMGPDCMREILDLGLRGRQQETHGIQRNREVC